ncbi:MAG: ATP-binding protein [Phycisphaerales bacterium]|nr:ATP-binding protein [Planctomycetota bacterium]MCH8508993.1 ATP-binding protein [Phycisphaerales bacterium]
MDAVRNPYAPGAGTQPPELAGRDAMLETVRVSLARIRVGRSAKSVVLIGLRGVGKTVLLERMRLDAEGDGIHTVRLEAPEERSLPSLLAPQLRQVLLRLSTVEKAKDRVNRAMRALAGFVQALRFTYKDISVGIDVEPEAGLADNGDLEHDLQVLLELIGEAAKAAGTAVGIFIDEMQYIADDELGALITALHRVSQRQLPVTMVGAGLPQLPGKFGNAKSYAERLFDFEVIGPLKPEDARRALQKPAQDEGAGFEPAALDRIVAETQGYPYFIQEWGKHTWDISPRSPFTLVDVERASGVVIQELDEGFFRVRFDRMTPAEREYLRAMAELGPGPHRSGDIAEVLGRKVQSVGPVRANLIKKGMVWSPSHGDTGFTVPLFDGFMKRVMPRVG